VAFVTDETVLRGARAEAEERAQVADGGGRAVLATAAATVCSAFHSDATADRDRNEYDLPSLETRSNARE